MITNNNDDVSKESTSTGPATAATTVSKDVFLGIDAAKVKQVVTRFVAGEGAKPAEGMSVESLLARIARLVKEGWRVHCVYESGPTGFGLCRQIIALGATCLVVRAKRLDRHQRRRKHDAQDSRHLAEDLAAHHFGRTGLLVPVRVPTEEEELRRLPVRQRESLSRCRHQLLNAAKGRALALGYCLPKQWWRPRVLPGVLKTVPAQLARDLKRTAAAAAAILEQQEQVEAELTADAPPVPVGVGALTASVLEREVCTWARFKTGKKLSSFAGLCPSENSTGGQHRLGAIDKHGSPRLRYWCQEVVMRLFKYQPGYYVIKWARQKMTGAGPARRKQILVAVARRFLVDWWKLRTGQTSFDTLGLTCAKT
jgi:transposase